MHDLHHRIDHACPGVAHYSLLLCWAKERIGEEGRGKEKEWDEAFVYFLCFPSPSRDFGTGGLMVERKAAARVNCYLQKRTTTGKRWLAPVKIASLPGSRRELDAW
jgi:hypothetical protein